MCIYIYIYIYIHTNNNRADRCVPRGRVARVRVSATPQLGMAPVYHNML